MGGATPAVGGVNDVWILDQRNNPTTQGSWAVDAKVFWVPALDPAAGFARGNVPESGPILFSTTTQPTNLGSVVVGRSAGGTWDCTGAHTPA